MFVEKSDIVLQEIYFFADFFIQIFKVKAVSFSAMRFSLGLWVALTWVPTFIGGAAILPFSQQVLHEENITGEKPFEDGLIHGV